MRNVESEFLLIKNLSSGNRFANRRAVEINNRLKHFAVKDFTELQRGEIKEIPGKVIVLGGDGTVQACIAWLKAHDESPTIIVAGGGTGNIFRKSVISEGATLALNDINNLDKVTGSILSFRPAIIRDEAEEEKSLFVIAAGFGQFERSYSKYRETIRQLPLPAYLQRKASQLLAVLNTGISSGDGQELLLNMYSTGPMLHGIKVFSNEELSLNSTNIGLVQIKDMNPQMAVAKFVYAVSLWRLGIKPPSSIASTEVNVMFCHSPSQQGSKATLDGEIRQMSKDANLTIRRSNTEFSVVALV